MSTRSLLYESELVDELSRSLRKANEFAFALALITPTGLQLLLEEMRRCLRRGGTGRVLAGTDLPTHPDALDLLLRLSLEFPKTFRIRRSQSPESRYFHPKVYLFPAGSRAGSAIVGSANLTNGGLTRNYEASLWTSEKSAVAGLIDYFDELFGGAHSRPVTDQWLKEYRRLWIERQKIDQKARKARELVRKIQEPTGSRERPKRIQGCLFVFTGGIKGWPRERRLYPEVRRLGGTVGSKASALSRANWLVHCDSLSKGDSTLKIKVAHELGVPIISEEEFMRARDEEMRIRRARR